MLSQIVLRCLAGWLPKHQSPFHPDLPFIGGDDGIKIWCGTVWQTLIDIDSEDTVDRMQQLATSVLFVYLSAAAVHCCSCCGLWWQDMWASLSMFELHDAAAAWTWHEFVRELRDTSRCLSIQGYWRPCVLFLAKPCFLPFSSLFHPFSVMSLKICRIALNCKLTMRWWANLIKVLLILPSLLQGGRDGFSTLIFPWCRL